jgi:hypothetical protein
MPMKMPKKFKVPAKEKLSAKQDRFGLMQAYWRIWVKENFPGYLLTKGDAYRDPRSHGATGKRKPGVYGRATSLHKSRLAQDWNLIIDGKLQHDNEAHREIGEAWASMSTDASSGVDFKDGNHYSLSHGGRR